jgi:hypothetical protein
MSGEGRVFELVNNGDGTYTSTTLVNFSGTDGEFPMAGLITDAGPHVDGPDDVSA